MNFTSITVCALRRMRAVGLVNHETLRRLVSRVCVCVCLCRVLQSFSLFGWDEHILILKIYIYIRSGLKFPPNAICRMVVSLAVNCEVTDRGYIMRGAAAAISKRIVSVTLLCTIIMIIILIIIR